MSHLEVRIDVVPEIELHEKKDELVISPPQQQPPDNTEAAGNGSNEEKGKNRKSPPPQDQDNVENIHKQLHKAALRNDWFTAYWMIFGGDRKKNSKYATASLTDKNDNALHIAAIAGSSIFIYFLQKYMSKEDLERLNADGNTAFYLAAKNGRFKCAGRMLEKNKELPSIRGDAGTLPIQIAAQRGHIRTVKDLYKVHYDATNPRKLSREDCEKLLPNLICRADLIVSHTNKRPHEKLPEEALDLLKHLLDKIDPHDDWMDGVIDDAVKHENVEFLSLIICKYSQLMNCTKGDRKTAGLIFSNAISKRQKDIFQLRESLRPSFKGQILDYKDGDQNNILHLAGKLSPPEQLAAICGAAVQLQQELKWFEEVSNMVDASKAYEKNKDEKTPKALFDEEHKQLKERGEQWMKDTANSCMIVAALIATVVFAAAFTVPGGTNEESGMPRFSNKLSFRIFVFADARSLLLSVYSLKIFLVIHTSRYAEKDFLLELPKKLVAGLLTLLLSIVAMMVLFCTSIFIVFKVDNIWVRILFSVSASLPVLHFAKMKGRFLFDLLCKTSEINFILK